MEIKNLKTGNLIRFGGEHFKRLVKLQETTGVKYFTKKDLAGCVSADKKNITKTQQKVKKLGTNAKRKQKGGVLIDKDTVRKYPTKECPVCHEEWDETIIPFQIDECGHEICTKCAKRWFVQKNENSCPLCRVEVNVAVVMDQLCMLRFVQIVDIFEAIRMWNIKKVKQYIEQGGDVNAKDENGNTPFHIACASTHMLPICMFNRTREILIYLVDKGANVNAKNMDGEKPRALMNSKYYNQLMSADSEADTLS